MTQAGAPSAHDRNHGRNHNHNHNHGRNHNHNHNHGHGHGHRLSLSRDNERRVFWVMIFTGVYAAIQVVGGILSGSLALLADSGHMASDAASLALAWCAFRMARRPATYAKSYGWHRFEVLAAFVNGLTLFAIAGWVIVEAVQRFFAPPPILGLPMLAVAAAGLAVNLVAFIVLRQGSRDNLNLRGALLHVLGDLLGSVGAIAAALIILAAGWGVADPILSVLVALLILKSAWGLIRQSGHILLEGTPENLAAEAVEKSLKQDVRGIVDVHHLHLWSLTAERTLASLHVVVAPEEDRNAVLREARRLMDERFGIDHATIQIEDEALCEEGNSCQT